MMYIVPLKENRTESRRICWKRQSLRLDDENTRARTHTLLWNWRIYARITIYGEFAWHWETRSIPITCQRTKVHTLYVPLPLNYCWVFHLIAHRVKTRKDEHNERIKGREWEWLISDEIDSMEINFSFSFELETCIDSVTCRNPISFPNNWRLSRTTTWKRNYLSFAEVILCINMVMTISYHLFIRFRGVRVFLSKMVGICGIIIILSEYGCVVCTYVCLCVRVWRWPKTVAVHVTFHSKVPDSYGRKGGRIQCKTF